MIVRDEEWQAKLRFCERYTGRPSQRRLETMRTRLGRLIASSWEARMTMQRQVFGKTGEDLAVAELERRGYVILERRYRTRHGEIDIVAREGRTTVFVEVKARSTGEFGSAAEAVTPLKQRRLWSMAVDYLARHRLMEQPCRFDVVAVDGTGAGAAITLYRSAFGGS